MSHQNKHTYTCLRSHRHAWIKQKKYMLNLKQHLLICSIKKVTPLNTKKNPSQFNISVKGNSNQNVLLPQSLKDCSINLSFFFLFCI